MSVGGTDVAVGGTDVAVAGTDVAVGGTDVAVAGTDVAVAGTDVAVAGTGVSVGGTDVAVGGTTVSVGGRGVAVGGTGVAVAAGGTGVDVGVGSAPPPHAVKARAIKSTIIREMRGLRLVLIIEVLPPFVDSFRFCFCFTSVACESDLFGSRFVTEKSTDFCQRARGSGWMPACAGMTSQVARTRERMGTPMRGHNG